MAKYTKKKMVDHIHHLFVVRPEMSGLLRLVCVLRGRELKVILPPFTNPSDLVIVDYFMEPDSLSLRTLIQRSINKNWDTLRTGKEIRFRFWLSEDKAGKEAKCRPTGW